MKLMEQVSNVERIRASPTGNLKGIPIPHNLYSFSCIIIYIKYSLNTEPREQHRASLGLIAGYHHRLRSYLIYNFVRNEKSLVQIFKQVE